MTRICLVFCSFFLLSCSVNSKKSGGSVVGNGMIRFYNEIYDYSFLYDSRLTLTKLSTEQISIDNSTIANRIYKPTSRMEIEVSKAESLDLEALLAYAKNKDPNATWQPISVTGVNGVFHKIEMENSLSAQYLFSLGTNGVLSIKINARTEADGISLISPIVETLSFDTIAPVVYEMAFDPPVVKAGQTAKLRIRASDNLTEIRGQSLNGSVETGSQKECRGLLIYSKKQIETCGDFRAIGNGWYEIDVPTNPRMQANLYLLYPLTIWDGAGNSRYLSPNPDLGIYESRWDDSQEPIPLVYLKVENDNPDVQKPALSNVRFEPEELLAGEKGKLIFQASDDDPAFNITSYCEHAVHENWNNIKRTDIPRDGLHGETEFFVRICDKKPVRTGDNWEVEFESLPNIPPGTYNLGFTIRDSVNNDSETGFAKLKVTNNSEVDLEGPKFLEAKPDKTTYRPGESGSIFFKIVDNLSGVTRTKGRVFTGKCDIGLVRLEYDIDDKNDYLRIPLCDGEFRHVEGDWYAIDFKLGVKIPTGDYWLPSFEVQDHVGNSTYISAFNPTSIQTNYRYVFQDSISNVSVVKLRVVNN
jgi:hypothetical protein